MRNDVLGVETRSPVEGDAQGVEVESSRRDTAYSDTDCSDTAYSDTARGGTSRKDTSRADSDAIVERALASSPIYTESQKQNVRHMADDLWEGRRVWQSVPFRILFEFNRRCNVQCVHCSIDRRNTGELSPHVLERLLEQIGHGSIEIMPFLGGEPTLAPLAEAGRICREHSQWLNLITNGVLFDRECFESIADVTARVQYSFHSHRRDIFERVIPGVDFDRVVKNLEDGVRIAERTGAHIVACVVPMFDMLDRLSEYVQFVADRGVKRIIVQNLYPHTPGKSRLGEDACADTPRNSVRYAEMLATAKRLGVFIETNVPQLFGDPENVPRVSSPFDLLQDNAHIVQLFRPEFCISTALQLVIEWDGTVLPCIRDRIPLGNLLTQEFDAIWNGPVMQRLRTSHFERTPSPKCASCRKFYLDHP